MHSFIMDKGVLDACICITQRIDLMSFLPVFLCTCCL